MTKQFPHNADFTRLFILRHAQTALNADGRIQGETDAGLNAQGRQQARKAARRLARFYQLDHIYSSPYPRARETAGIVARPFKLEVEANDDLHELSFGKINNERFIDLEKLQPDYFHQINNIYASKAEEGLCKPPFPEGESIADIRSRIESFTTQLLAQHRGQFVVAVSHGGFIKYMLAYYAGISLEDPLLIFVENASISIVDFYQNRSILMVLNDYAHLEIPVRFSRPSVI
jgi:broad specificity phosphatase PhoE